MVLDGLDKKYQKAEIADEDFKKLLQGENFGKIYAYTLNQAYLESGHNPEIITGKWIEYEQESDPTTLTNTLQGHGTGWCIAGESTARSYLKKSSVRVCYSNDPLGQATVPRLAVVEKNDQITEIRGIESDQNVDQHIQPILDEELNRLGSKGETYQKASADMKRSPNTPNLSLIHISEPTRPY